MEKLKEKKWKAFYSDLCIKCGGTLIVNSVAPESMDDEFQTWVADGEEIKCSSVLCDYESEIIFNKEGEPSVKL